MDKKNAEIMRGSFMGYQQKKGLKRNGAELKRVTSKNN